MKISAISNNLTFTNNIDEFNQNSSKVTAYTKNILQNKEPLFIKKISNNVYDTFTKTTNDKIKNIEKFSVPFNKSKILQETAKSMYNAEKYEDAGIILGTSFNILSKDLGAWENDKKNLLNDETNIQILKAFYSTSNNIKAKCNVMKSINELNNPLFLPIAEAVCNCDDDIITPNDKKTIYQAREFLNKHYDLNILKDFIDQDNDYKIGVLKVVSKWGTAKNIDMIKNLENDKNLQIATLAQKTIKKLRNIDKYSDIDIEINSPDVLKVNQDFQSSLDEYINKNSGLKDLKYSASSKNILSLRKAIKIVEDKDKRDNLKILLANISDKDYDLSVLERTIFLEGEKRREFIEAYLKMYVRSKRKENIL